MAILRSIIEYLFVVMIWVHMDTGYDMTALEILIWIELRVV
jgi:hypothetical protein